MHIGLIGGGGITETHARAALAIPGVRVAAIQGRRDDRVRQLCERYGGTPYTDFDAFLAHRPMDLVIVGSPSGAARRRRAPLPARLGLHVLVEKPIDISARPRRRADRGRRRRQASRWARVSRTASSPASSASRN